ncbi:uncharacterized protein KY384_000146 [Bacidia gigantensis]|uniref:uncharacterized protein n=1 Tax=Bacidia gigantensis TaxID=2732470 RepID=UPI001D045182|nr:uncharacterized protein KY384_000146 [Bacidia gigantensis]KAG8526153.1 hypothetical protein KY384_000146 [Bacidia gigantensis]
MSFGVSISDVGMLVKLAWRTVQSTRHADSEHDELSCAALSLHSTLRRLEGEVKNPKSLLNKPEDPYRKEVEAIGSGCRKTLTALDKILEKYSSLNGGARGIPNVWQRFRFGNEEMTIKDIRGKMIFYTSALSLYLNMVSVGSSGRVERQMEAAGGDLKELKSAVNTITAHLMSNAKEEGSQMTAYTDDDKGVWREFRRELVKKGFRSSLLHKHRGTIQSYVNELGDRGIMDETEETDIQAAVLPSVLEMRGTVPPSSSMERYKAPSKPTPRVGNNVQQEGPDQGEEQEASSAEDSELTGDSGSEVSKVTDPVEKLEKESTTSSLPSRSKEASGNVPRSQSKESERGDTVEKTSVDSSSNSTKSLDDAEAAPDGRSPSPGISITESLGTHRSSVSWIKLCRAKADIAESNRRQWRQRVDQELFLQREESQGVCCVYDGWDVSTLFADFEVRVTTLQAATTMLKGQLYEGIVDRIKEYLVDAKQILYEIVAAGLYDCPDGRRTDWVYAHLLADSGEKMVAGAWFLNSGLPFGDHDWRQHILQIVRDWLTDVFFKFFLDRDSVIVNSAIPESQRAKLSGETFKKQKVICSIPTIDRIRRASYMRFADIRMIDQKITITRDLLDKAYLKALPEEARTVDPTTFRSRRELLGYAYLNAQLDDFDIIMLTTRLRSLCETVFTCIEDWPAFQNERLLGALKEKFGAYAREQCEFLHKLVSQTALPVSNFKSEMKGNAYEGSDRIKTGSEEKTKHLGKIDSFVDGLVTPRMPLPRRTHTFKQEPTKRLNGLSTLSKTSSEGKDKKSEKEGSLTNEAAGSSPRDDFMTLKVTDDWGKLLGTGGTQSKSHSKESKKGFQQDPSATKAVPGAFSGWASSKNKGKITGIDYTRRVSFKKRP